MKQYLSKIISLSAIALLLHSSGIAQDEQDTNKDKTEKSDGFSNDDEIVIKRNGDKDIKVTVEVKGDKVYINGKPTNEYDGDDVSVTTKKPFYNQVFRNQISPFRNGGWSIDSDGDVMTMGGGKTAFLGVNWDDVDKGAEVTSVVKESAAEKGGLQKGDIITKIGDKKVEDGNLADVIHDFKAGDKVTVTFLRNGKEQTITTTLEKSKLNRVMSFGGYTMPKAMTGPVLANPPSFNFNYPYALSKPRLGIRAQDLEESKGAKILDIEDESPADKAGLKEGDIINEFEGKPVDSADDLAKLARENKEKYSYKIKFTRDGKSQEVEVKIPRRLKTADL